MAEKKTDQSSKQVKKVEAVEPEKKAEQSKAPQAKPEKRKSPGTAGLKATTGKVTKKAKQVAERAANGAAKVGKAAQELGEGLQKKVENDIVPAAERAKKGLSETSQKVREELAPAAEMAKKVAEDLKPAAEKAGKGLSAVFRATARATRKSARILGIKASISAALRKRQKLFAQLGESYFRAQKKKTQSKSDQEGLKSLVAAIEAVNSDIRSLEAEEKLARESS
jgi:hypothetical protein